jgi:hypothetical protein
MVTLPAGEIETREALSPPKDCCAGAHGKGLALSR